MTAEACGRHKAQAGKAGRNPAGLAASAEADAALVFEKNTATMWEDLMRRLGKRPGPRQPGERDARLAAPVEGASEL